MLSIEKVKKGIREKLGFKQFVFKASDERVIQVYKELIRQFYGFQNLQYSTGRYSKEIHMKENRLHEIVNEFYKVVARTDL
jgi:hypothetical protein